MQNDPQEGQSIVLVCVLSSFPGVFEAASLISSQDKVRRGRQNASNGSLEHCLVSCQAVVIAVENIVFGKIHLFGELHPPGSFDEILF